MPQIRRRPETMAKLVEIDKEIRDGMSLRDACEKHSLSKGTYYEWRDEQSRKTKAATKRAASKPRLLSIPVAEPAIGQLMCFLGSAQQLAELAARLR